MKPKRRTTKVRLPADLIDVLVEGMVLDVVNGRPYFCRRPCCLSEPTPSVEQRPVRVRRSEV